MLLVYSLLGYLCVRVNPHGRLSLPACSMNQSVWRVGRLVDCGFRLGNKHISLYHLQLDEDTITSLTTLTELHGIDDFLTFVLQFESEHAPTMGFLESI